MKALFKFLLLLCVIAIPALAVCPDRPTLPTGIIPSSSPLLITSSSAGISNCTQSSVQSIKFISSIIDKTIIYFYDRNTSRSMYSRIFLLCFFYAVNFDCFSINIQRVQPSSGATYHNYLSINCGTLAMTLHIDFGGTSSDNVLPNPISSVADPLAIFVTFDLDARKVRLETLSQSKNSLEKAFGMSGIYSFDANSKFYLCSDWGSSARACTVSDFVFEYRYYGLNSFTWAHLGGTDPGLAACYPLAGGSLASSIGSASSAFLGDKPSNPTPGTSPSWDSSNSFVTMFAGQFLTFPLPSLSSTNPTLSSSFSFAAWVKITSIPASVSTIFSMHSADGTQVGYKLTVTQASKQISINFGSVGFTSTGGFLVVTLDTWQLIGFTAYLSADKKTNQGTMFTGTPWVQFSIENSVSAMDLSTASMIRIGGATDSIVGQVSIVRIMNPGGGFIKTSDLCLATNSIELGIGSFALACSGSNILNPADNKCYSSSCSSGTYLVASFTKTPICLTCPKSHCNTCNSTQCLTCETNYFLNEGDCVNLCPDGKYSDGTACQSCPTSCSKCTSSTICQACSSGYTLTTNSTCIIPPPTPTPPPSSLQAETSASQAVSSAVTAVGSAVSVGSSVLPIVGLVSEVVQNTRYLNLSVSEDLAQIYKTFSTNMIDWDLPNFLSEVEDYKPLSELFSRYDLDSSFLVNFWSTMMTVGVSLCLLVVCLGVQKLFFERKSGGFFYFLIRKMIGASINFIIVQAYGSLDNILFYFVLDAKTNPFDNTFARISFAFGIIFIMCGSALMFFSVRAVYKFHILKREGLAKNDLRDFEAHQKKNKYLEVFYGDFNDADTWGHCFLAFLILRNNVSSLVLTILYDYPLMQTIFLIILDGGILLFMLIEKPFTTLHGTFFQYYFELIVLLVHICCFILSWDDEPSEGLKIRVCSAIIYLNTALVTGGLGFMFIDVYEVAREKFNEWKLKRAEKEMKNVGFPLPLPEESGISLHNDSTMIVETESPRRKFQTKNFGHPSLQLRRNFPKNHRLKSPEMKNLSKNHRSRSPKKRNFRKSPKIEFMNNKDFNLP